MDFSKERLIEDITEFLLDKKLLENTGSVIYSELLNCYSTEEQRQIEEEALYRFKERYTGMYGEEL